jgi:hypothetical protein
LRVSSSSSSLIYYLLSTPIRSERYIGKADIHATQANECLTSFSLSSYVSSTAYENDKKSGGLLSTRWLTIEKIITIR